MTSRQPYTYTILRYVHDTVTGEFVNVGVLMYAPEERLLKIRVRKSIGRIKSVFPDLDREFFMRSVRNAERAFQIMSKDLPLRAMKAEDIDVSSFARLVLVADDSSMQWAKSSGGVTKDTEQTFQRIYNRFITQYDSKVKHRRTDDEVWRPVRDLLEEKNIPVEFDEKIVSSRTDEIVFKRAWRNGVWHAYEPVSFDLIDADGIKDKARRWRGHLEAVHDGLRGADLRLSFIVGAPQNASLNGAYENAIKILEGSAFSPEVYKESDIPQLVDKIEDEVRAHRAQT